ncbi:MAG: alpha-L-fucosidase [Pirellulales bacterium]|nr:alpha-L-fucosidase [Pirellulales bacterium]
MMTPFESDPRRAGLRLSLAAALFLVVAVCRPTAADQDMLAARPESIQSWQDMRFGMFVCWGPVSLTGEEIGWSRGAPRGGELRTHQGQGPTPGEVYDNLYKQWKPDNFDARQWVQTALEAGAKYMIFLVKHHDGYCLYDSKLTDYKSTSPQAAWQHDVMADIADACHEKGLKLMVYYSQPDWRHPDYQSKTHARYIQYLHGQIRELLSGYGRIDGLWFDGLGGKAVDWGAENLFRMSRTLQPWLVINNRCGLPGDYDTPEQRLGAFQLDRPWETCMTLGTQWSWKPEDRIKSLKECIDALVTCAGRNGNLALNTGPMPDGRIEPRQAERFRQIGAWLRQYGESIYGTRGGPFWALNCLSTRRQNTIYVHVLRWYDDTLTLPPLPRKLVSCRLLTGGTPSIEQTDRSIAIGVPAEHRQELDTILTLELDGSAMDLEAAHVDWGPLTFGKKVIASHIYDKNPQAGAYYRPENAVDGDPQTGWTFNPGTPSAWIEVDLGREETIDRAWLNEPYDRIRRFELQVKRAEQWITVHEGTVVGEDCSLKFPPVTTRFVRLQVLGYTVNPLVGELQVFRSKSQ